MMRVTITFDDGTTVSVREFDNVYRTEVDDATQGQFILGVQYDTAPGMRL